MISPLILMLLNGCSPFGEDRSKSDTAEEVSYPNDCFDPSIRETYSAPSEPTDIHFVAHTYAEDSFSSDPVWQDNITYQIENFNRALRPFNYQIVVDDTLVHDGDCEIVSESPIIDGDEETEWTSLTTLDTNVPGVLDVYFCGAVSFPYFSYAPIGKGVMAIGYGGMVFAHEAGHALGLYHTFEKEFGEELADGSTAYSGGDLLATPADAIERFYGDNDSNECRCLAHVLVDDGITVSYECTNSVCPSDSQGQELNPSYTNIESYHDDYGALIYDLVREDPTAENLDIASRLESPFDEQQIQVMTCILDRHRDLF